MKYRIINLLGRVHVIDMTPDVEAQYIRCLLLAHQTRVRLCQRSPVAEMLRRMDLECIARNPGPSFRSFHDSLVNYLGNRDPQILLCLHC
jgi:hypothetical protein